MEKRTVSDSGAKNLPSLFSERAGEYPQQTTDPVDPTSAGEYRGYYKSVGEEGGRWFPRQSTHRGRAGGAHNGIDIYARYAPFPRETPILAATDGTFSPVFDDLSPDDVGNRARIETTFDGKSATFIYGHLARFHGGGRKVKKGDVIGYAGCSGNANAAGECSTVGGCGVTSCHVHLIAAFGSKVSENNGKKKTVLNDVNPAELLGWKLGFKNNDNPIRCKDWTGPKHPNGPEIPSEQGELKATVRTEWPRVAGKNGSLRHNPLPAPFDLHEFDDTRAIVATRNAYDLIATRLMDADVGKRLLEPVVTAYLGSGTAAEKIQEAVAAERDTLLASTDGPLGGQVNRVLILLHHAFWHLIGGQAMTVALSQRTFDRYVKDELALNSEEIKKFRTVTLFESGIGVDGEARLVSVDHGQSAHHRTQIKNYKEGDTEGDTKEVAVTSIGFGRGSLMQATWPEDISSTDIATEFYLIRLRAALMALWHLETVVYRNEQALRADTVEIRNGAVASIDAALGIVLIWLPDLTSHLSIVGLDDVAKEERREALGLLIKDLSSRNAKLFELARLRSNELETGRQVGPAFLTFEIVEPAPAPTAPPAQGGGGGT